MTDSYSPYYSAGTRDVVFPEEHASGSFSWMVSGIKSIVKGIGRASQRMTQPPDRFKLMRRRAKTLRGYDPRSDTNAPNGHFSGRPIISECSKVNGGVYLGVLPQEAVVVDEQHGYLSNVYRELCIVLRNCGLRGSLDERAIFNHVVTMVERYIKFDPKRFDELAIRERIACDVKVSLDLFIRERSGLARHQVLLAAYLVEKLKGDGYLNGLGIIDGRSYVPAYNDDRLMYIAPIDGLLIFDPLKNLENRISLI